MNTPTPDYGEPWSYGYGKVDREGYPSDNLRTWIQTHGETCDTFNGGDECNPFVMPGVHLARAMRAVACVNACAGLSDPAAHLAAMKEAIREAHEALEDWQLLWKEVAGQVSSRIFADGWPIEKATTSTLTKLQPFIK